MGLQQRAYDYDYEYPVHHRTRHAVEAQPVRREKKRIKAEKHSVPASRYVIIIVAVVLINVLLVCRQNIVLQRGYELSHLNNELTALQEENQRLTLAVGKLESLDRIENIALSRLGMVHSDQIRLVSFQPTEPLEGDSVTIAGSTQESWFGRIAAAIRGDSARAEASGTQP